MTYRAVRLAIVLVLLSPAAWAETAPGVAPSVLVAEDPHWLSEPEMDAIIDQIPAPPVPGTPEDAADIHTEVEAETARTKERSDQAVIDAGNAAPIIMKDADPQITPANDAGFYQFLEQVQHQAAEVDHIAKLRWKRPRPFVAHPDLIHPLFSADEYSYPSGHSTVAMCDTVILAQIFPDKATVLTADAERIADSRVVAGVHYQTDIEQGKAMGKLVAAALLAKPAFIDAMNAAKARIGR